MKKKKLKEKVNDLKKPKLCKGNKPHNMKKKVVCTNYEGKGFVSHNWKWGNCECPDCGIGEHKECYRCGEIKS